MKPTRLFEDAYTTKGVQYLREYNTETKKSEIRKTDHKSEYYLKDPMGEYRSFLEPSVKLRRAEGSSYGIDQAYGSKSSDYVSIREEHFEKGSYNKDINTWYLDIETSVGTVSTGFPNPEEANEPIVLIQLWDSQTKKGYVLGREEWVYRADYKYDFDLEYIQYNTEKELMNGYLDLFKKLDPFIITAFHGDGFDFPYIFNRLKRLKISTNRLSNYGKASLKTKKLDNGQIVNNLETQGHWYVDSIDVYKKFVSIYEPVASMSLDFVGEKETGIKKVDHSNYIKFDDFRVGKYKVMGNETEEQKATKIHRCAVALEKDPNMASDKKAKLQKYIKDKSHSEFIHYGVMDFVILKGIFEKRNLIGIMMQMAEMMGCRIPDTIGTLKAWDAYISASILKNKMITPPKQNHERPSIVGGYVAAPVVGKHKWILSADINSMYPLLGMVAHNLSPETFIPINKRPRELQMHLEKHYYDQDESRILKLTDEIHQETTKLLQKYNITLGFNGAVYSKEQEGVVPILVKDIYKNRKQAKKEMFDFEKASLQEDNQEKKNELLNLEGLRFTKQLTLKLAINALYGAMAQQYFSLFNEDLAASITMNGRVYILIMSNFIVDELERLLPGCNPAIYNDTDSFYFSIEPFIEKYCKDKSLEEKVEWADRFYEKVVDKAVTKSISYFSKLTNAYAPEAIGAEREVIADAGIFTAKKKYTIRVRDNEGVRYDIDKPSIKVTGLEVKTSGIAPFAKKYLKEAIPVILDKTDSEIKDWFQDTRSKFTGAHLFDIAKTIGVSKLENPNWGKVVNGRKVSPPFGSKTVLATNRFIQDNNLTEEFALIDAGTKVKILYLSKPNPFKNADAFAFTEAKFAERFTDYIDKEVTFDKFFVSPLENITDAIGLDVTNNVEELDDW